MSNMSEHFYLWLVMEAFVTFLYLTKYVNEAV